MMIQKAPEAKAASKLKPKPFTHKQLVRIAANWLKNTKKCHLVASEIIVPTISECPDAIGWLSRGWSILVECKASRSDFLADKKKPCRNELVGLGQQRYYLTPRNLLRPEEVPDRWGLLEVREYLGHRGHYVKVLKKAQRIEICISFFWDIV
jgi:hypothetical protein